MKNIKAQQRDKIILEYGILIQPLMDLVKATTPSDIKEYRVALAKIQSGDSAWRLGVKQFASFADDLFFNKEFQEISHVNEIHLRRFQSEIEDTNYQGKLDVLQSKMNSLVKDYKRYFLEKIDLIPIEWEPEIFLANTPFTSYLKLKDLIGTAKSHIHYFDRYLKVDFIHLFLRDIDREISIRLTTTHGNSNYGVSHLLPVSNLARQEFSDYQLIEVDQSQIHDRNIRVDGNIFSLGPGIDRSGLALTNFGPSDNSQNAHTALDGIMVQGNIIHQS